MSLTRWARSRSDSGESWLAYLFGAILIFCGAGLLAIRTVPVAALTLGSLWFPVTLVLDVPKYAADAGSMALRTGVFEPLAIASLAWLPPGGGATPHWLERESGIC
jgi:hypothetical protein